jgi:hypothetical protein
MVYALHTSLSSAFRACTTFLRNISAISLARVTFELKVSESVTEALGMTSVRIFSLNAGLTVSVDGPMRFTKVAYHCVLLYLRQM